MDVLTYVLASPWTRIAALMVGFTSGLVGFSLLAKVVQK